MSDKIRRWAFLVICLRFCGCWAGEGAFLGFLGGGRIGLS